MSEMKMRHKDKPRSEKEVKQLKNRIHRIQGQLNGIERMLDENRYCMDILIQISAIESALRSMGYLVLNEHLETCVRDKAKEEDPAVMQEVLEMIKKLK